MIKIIDYGVGNIRAFANVYKELDISVKIAHTVDCLENTSKIILPGVGSFDYAIQSLENSGMKDKIIDMVINDKIPILGICVGMQMLSESSEEGKLPGLGLIKGRVKKFEKQNTEITQIPHMGWNSVHNYSRNKLFLKLGSHPMFYFLHSYYLVCKNQEDMIASADYGIEFTAAVNKDNIYGIQCHPEKSHQNGIQVLNNFALM